MPKQSIPYTDTGYFSKTMCDYLQAHQALNPFYNRFPNIQNFKTQLEEKQASSRLSPQWRKTLSDTLTQAYQGFQTSNSTKANLELLTHSNTFTITTGHQLNLFTGPLYFLFKIVSVINLCKQLKQQYPEFNFVPMYWMASEDHDFDEINYFNFKGKKIQWDRQDGGAVGELDTQGIATVFNQFASELGPGTHANELAALFKQAYLAHSNLADATRFIGNALFSEQGLVIVDGNHSALKKAFIPFAKLELTKQQGHAQITQTTKALVNAGYTQQVHPREINLFYLTPGNRERIIQDDNGYQINNTNIRFSQAELLEELNTHPERFSPNALLRPLFQEVILPNLCYIGGGGELAYWLQLKDYFESVQVVFPMLLLRNSALLITAQQQQKIGKLQLEITDLFLKQPEMLKNLVKKHSNISIDFSSQKALLTQQFKDLYHLAEQTDKSFLGAVAAQEKKQHNGLDNLEKRLLKAQKRKLAQLVSRATRLQDELFPKHSLQERQANFSEFYLENGEKLIDLLLQELDPLSGEFTVITV